MKKYGFSPAFVGLCFCVPAIIYASLSPVMYILVKKISRRATIFLGIFCLGIGMAFVGTSKTLGLDNNPAMIIMGLMIIGAASGMTSVPCLPEMLEAV
jgi:cyanate permease